jgi:hypothetical protein
MRLRQVGHCVRFTVLSGCTCGYPKESEVVATLKSPGVLQDPDRGLGERERMERPHNVAFEGSKGVTRGWCTRR